MRYHAYFRVFGVQKWEVLKYRLSLVSTSSGGIEILYCIMMILIYYMGVLCSQILFVLYVLFKISVFTDVGVLQGGRDIAFGNDDALLLREDMFKSSHV